MKTPPLSPRHDLTQEHSLSYATPALVVYGRIAELTAGGTAVEPEGNPGNNPKART